MLDPRLCSLRVIAEALGTSSFQVLRLASLAPPSRPLTARYRDPLRLRSLHGVDFIRRSRLDAWRNRNQRDGAGEKRVLGWEAICAVIGMRRSAAVAACGREVDPLPVVRPEGLRVWAYESALIDWCEAQELPHGAHRLVSAARKAGGGKASGEREASEPEAVAVASERAA